MKSTDTLVLVSGATGFLGSCLLRGLVEKGYRVRAMRREHSDMSQVKDLLDRVEWVEVDINDIVGLETAFEGVTHVCHCAAKVSFHPKDTRKMMLVNVDGTANMVNLALDFGVKKFIHVSSIAAIGRTKEQKNLSEQSKWTDDSAGSQYALSKYLGEQEVWRAQMEGLPTATVNPSIILGSGPWNSGAARFFSMLHKGLKLYPMGRSGFVDVRDVADFMLRLLESDIENERYILNGANISFKEFLDKVALSIGAKQPSIKITPFLAEMGWRVEWLKEKLFGTKPLVTKDSARSSLSGYNFDNAKSLALPGFAYRTLDTTIADVAADFKKTVG